jgi:hypothetical protein
MSQGASSSQCIVLMGGPPPPTYLATSLPTTYLAWPPPPSCILIFVPPPTPLEEIEMARRRVQRDAKKRYREAKVSRDLALEDQADQAAAAAYAEIMARGGAAAQEEAQVDAEIDDDLPAAEMEMEDMHVEIEVEKEGTYVPPATATAEGDGDADGRGGHLFGDVLDMIITFLLSKGDRRTFLVARGWHEQSVACALLVPRPPNRQPLAVRAGPDAACGLCYEPFCGVRRATVLVACQTAHTFCWECVAKHSIHGGGERSCDALLVMCPMCRMRSSGVQVCGRAGLGEGVRVLLPGDVVEFACIHRKQWPRQYRDREEGYESRRRDEVADAALQRALVAAQVDVDAWWSTLGAEVALVSGACSAAQLHRVASLSATQVAVSIHLLSHVRDEVLQSRLGSDERTADVVIRELERRAGGGLLRVTAAIQQIVVARRLGGGGDGRRHQLRQVRTRTRPFVPYS